MQNANNANNANTPATGWGGAPQSGGGQKREVPYIDYSAENTNIAQFVPFSDIEYHMTIPLVNGWVQPVEMWTHDILRNGRFWGNVLCKNIAMGMDECPLCKLNKEKEAQIAPAKITNAQRPAPIKTKVIFPVIIDEIPEKPFLLYKTSSKFLQQIVQQFTIAGSTDVKLILKRTGTTMQDTVYTIANSGQPIDQNRIAQANIIAISPDNFKPVLIALEDFDKLGIGAPDQTPVQGTPQSGQQVGWGTGQPQQNVSTPQQNLAQQGGAPITDIGNGQVGASPFTGQAQGGDMDMTIKPEDMGYTQAQVMEAENFQMTVGPFSGKKLGELDDVTLDKVATRMTGNIQTMASIVVNMRKGTNVAF